MTDSLRLEKGICESRVDDLRFGVIIGMQLAHYNPSKAEQVKRKLEEIIFEENRKLKQELKDKKKREFQRLMQNFLLGKKKDIYIPGEILHEESDEEETEKRIEEHDETEGKIEESDYEEEFENKTDEEDTQLNYEDLNKYISINLKQKLY